jgi:hypothetical protein
VATTFAAYVVMQFSYGDELKGIVGPLVIVAILAYFTANLFNEVRHHVGLKLQVEIRFSESIFIDK